MMAGVRAGGRLSVRAQNPGRLRLPERDVAAPPAPRALFSVVSRLRLIMGVLSGSIFASISVNGSAYN